MIRQNLHLHVSRGYSETKPTLLCCICDVFVKMLVVYLPWFQHIFQTEALSLNDLAFIVFVASSMVALDTARKLLFPDRQGDAPVSLSS